LQYCWSGRDNRLETKTVTKSSKGNQWLELVPGESTLNDNSNSPCLLYHFRFFPQIPWWGTQMKNLKSTIARCLWFP
jgi:hypothetical protein